MTGKSVHSLTGKSGQNTEHWNIIPDSVISDKNLSFAARCVYAVLAGSLRRESNVARIGQRRVAQILGMHQETVGLAIAALHDRGHLQIATKGKMRGQYVLTSNVFPMAPRVPREEGVFSNRRVIRDGINAIQQRESA